VARSSKRVTAPRILTGQHGLSTVRVRSIAVKRGETRMDASCFDTLVRSLVAGSSRRVIARAVGAALGLSLTHALATVSGAKKKRKKRKRTLRRNEFGCVNVGDKCRGKGTNCCSGICQGKKRSQARMTGAAVSLTTLGNVRSSRTLVSKDPSPVEFPGARAW
jgi:hypothetical protein